MRTPHRGTFCACIQYDEARAHRIYAGADALLVPSRFEPCGLTQLNAMHYGTIPIVRETARPQGHRGALQRLHRRRQRLLPSTATDAGLLLDAINRAKTLYFTNRYHWDEVVQRDMAKDVSWETPHGSIKTFTWSLHPGKIQAIYAIAKSRD